MTAAAGDSPGTLADLSLSEIRAELRKLLTLADTSVRPRPDRTLPEEHLFAPGSEWRVDYAGSTYDSWTPARTWSVLVREPDDVASAVYVHTPDSMPGDYLAVTTTEARALAMAILAACERADHQTAGVPQLAGRRTKAQPQRGDRVT